MTSPEDAPEEKPAPFAPPGGTPPPAAGPGAPAQPSGTQPAPPQTPAPGGWGQPSSQIGYGQPRYGQYAPGGAPQAAPGQQPYPGAPTTPTGYGSPQGGPQYGGQQYGGAQYGGQQQYGGPQHGGFPAPGWRPGPLKPGIIPLRPLSLGEIYDGAFAAIRKNPKVMLGVVALVTAVATIVPALISYLLAPSANQWLDDGVVTLFDDGSGQVSSELGLDGLAGQLSQTLLVTIGVYLGSIVTTGLLIVAISRSVIGKPFTVSDLWVQVRSKLVGLVAISLLPSIGILLVAGVFIGAVALLASADLVGLVLLVTVVALVAILVVAVWLTTRFILTPAAYVLEGQGLRSSIARGWTLSRGSFWRLFGIYLLSSIITSIVSGLVASPGTIIAGIFFPTGDTVPLGAVAITVVAQIIASTISTTFLSSVVALLYIDVRMRREGLDVELAAAADEV